MRLLKMLVLFGTLAFASGCITLSEYRFSLDCDTGKLERVYVDLRSKKGATEKDYSVEGDWEQLQEILADEEPEFDKDVVMSIDTKLFEEDGTLCARKRHVVNGPKCFPSKVALLTYVGREEWHEGKYQDTNGEIFLFLPKKKTVLSSNGQVLSTKKNNLIVWPGDTNRFEYVLRQNDSHAQGGESLLPFFRKQQKSKK